MPRQTEHLMWYTRRDGKVRGPYSAGHVTRYILLGRIRVTDELSDDRSSWRPLTECREFLPVEFGVMASWEDYQRLVMARISVDERRSQRRRNSGERLPAGVPERRHGPERRQLVRNIESFVWHLMGHEHDPCKRQESSSLRAYLLATLLVTLIVAWFSAVFR